MSDNKLVSRDGATVTASQDDQLRKVLPGVNIYENSDEILLQVEMPGVTKEAIAIDLDNGQLSLAARRLAMPGKIALYEEFGPVEYRRAFSVPQSINSDKVHAEFLNGMLNLHLPKSESFRPRSIEIKTG